MSELIIKYDDLCDMSTYSFLCSKEITEERERLRILYERAKDFDIVFCRVLQDRKTITNEEYQAYMTWYRHSNLTALEVARKIWNW